GTDTFQRELENDRTTQQQILNETSHMRAQMDDYEDNLNEINGKVYQANQLSNIILTVLLVVLIIIALIVVYLIIISRGV
ncbi:MAG: hypothetical protein IJ875_00510, partial [Solobacterium sp.]|nr:hypothetical protein [Solobacterium sp.]